MYSLGRAIAVFIFFLFLSNTVVALENNVDTRPIHPTIEDYDFSGTPKNISTTSSGHIQDAWIKIFKISPSVREINKSNQTLYNWVPQGGTALIGYGYSINLPKSDNYCGTRYSVISTGDDLTLNVINSSFFGTKKNNAYLVSYNIKNTGNVNFTAEATYYLNYITHHYTEECFGEGISKSCTCVHEYDTEHTDSMTLTDDINRDIYSPDLTTQLFKESTRDILSLHLILDTNASNIDGFTLQFDDEVFLSTSEYEYYNLDDRYTFTGKGLLQGICDFFKLQCTDHKETIKNIIALPGDATKAKNILWHKRGNRYYITLKKEAKNYSQISIIYHTHMGDIIQNITIQDTKKSSLKLSLDKRSYIPGEIAKVNINFIGEGPIKNKKIILNYSGLTYELFTNSEGKITKNIKITEDKRMIVSFENDGKHSTSSTIFLINSSARPLLKWIKMMVESLFILIFIYFSIKIIHKKYFK